MKPLTKNQIASVLGEPFGLDAQQVLFLLEGEKPVYWVGPPVENDSTGVLHSKKAAKTDDLDAIDLFPLPSLEPSRS